MPEVVFPECIEAVVFDCDGVLFESEPLHMEAWQIILRGRGHEFPISFFDPWIGRPCSDQARLYESTLAPRVAWKTYLDEKTAKFYELIHERLVPSAGVVENLEALRKLVPLAYATTTASGDMAVMMAITGLAPYFSASVHYEDVTEHKPHPEPYLEAARRLGVRPEACVAVEDSPAGTAAARAAGMCTLGVATSFGADVLVDAHGVFPTTEAACRAIRRHLACPTLCGV